VGLGQPGVGLGQPGVGLGQPGVGLGQPGVGLGQPGVGLPLQENETALLIDKLLRHLNWISRKNQTLVGWASRPP